MGRELGEGDKEPLMEEHSGWLRKMEERSLLKLEARKQAVPGPPEGKKLP